MFKQPHTKQSRTAGLTLAWACGGYKRPLHGGVSLAIALILCTTCLQGPSSCMGLTLARPTVLTSCLCLLNMLCIKRPALDRPFAGFSNPSALGSGQHGRPAPHSCALRLC